MSRYRNIHCLIWNDDRFPFTTDQCQLVFFHLMTTPLSTPFGLYKASMEALAAEKRWTTKAYREGFQEAFRQGFVKYDERVYVVYLPNFLKYNRPNNPNVLKGWVSVYEEIPNCALKNEFYQKLKAFAEGFQKGFDKAFAEAWPKPMPIQEQDQDLLREDPEEKTNTKTTPGFSANKPLATVDATTRNGHETLTPDWLVGLYNTRAPVELPRVQRLSDARRTKAQQYLRQFPEHAFWETVMHELGKSAFLRGRKPSPGHEHFRGRFDWLLSKGKDDQVENCLKVYEGKFRDGQHAPRPPCTHKGAVPIGDGWYSCSNCGRIPEATFNAVRGLV